MLVEIVFAWPGLGRLLYEATLARDYSLLMAMFLIAALGVVLGNLATDLVYTRLDPRVRLDRPARHDVLGGSVGTRSGWLARYRRQPGATAGLALALAVV